jgi:hypothetical protein
VLKVRSQFSTLSFISETEATGKLRSVAAGSVKEGWAGKGDQ